jgi:hypothetical protein
MNTQPLLSSLSLVTIGILVVVAIWQVMRNRRLQRVKGDHPNAEVRGVRLAEGLKRDPITVDRRDDAA